MSSKRINRRRFLRTTGAATASAAGLAWLPASATTPSGPRIAEAPPLSFGQLLRRINAVPRHIDVTTDERYWQSVQQAFNVDRSLTHLNNGGVCPAPVFVQQAEAAHVQEANRKPFYAYRAEVTPQIESVRTGVAECFGCDAEEIALTRNTSEGMEIVQLGVALQRGDEVVTTQHDYPRMMRTWEQRAARDGITVRIVDVPVPLHDPMALVGRIEAAVTARTKLVMCCHIVDLTGQVLPVREIASVSHGHGIPVLVDGAQTFGQFDFVQSDLDCDFYASSLHKWMMGPQGTGMLYVKRSRIPDVWPLMPAVAELDGDIRKFEDIGTECPARHLALAEALAFHRAIGAKRKAARLRYLRDSWLQPLMRHDRVSLQTNTGSAHGLATIDVVGTDPSQLRNHLWQRHRIRVRPINENGVRGIRVSPGLHTTLDELDRFVRVMDAIISNGLPG